MNKRAKKQIPELKRIYAKNKASSCGETLTCPSCQSKFKKTNYQQAFCKTKKGTKCKDFYWNNIAPTKRNNTTRISPASSAWMTNKAIYKPLRDFDDAPHLYIDELSQW